MAGFTLCPWLGDAAGMDLLEIRGIDKMIRTVKGGDANRGRLSFKGNEGDSTLLAGGQY